MGEYSVGNKTKNNILKACKQLFYENGVEDTSYDAICNMAEVNRGLIPYHFKGKGNIAGIIYEEFLKKKKEIVTKSLGEAGQNILFIAEEILLFREAKRNKKFCRFYCEVETNPDCYDMTLELQMQFINSLVEYNDLNMEESALRTICCMFEGVERELIQNIYCEYLTEPIDDITYRDIYFVFSTMGFHRERIKDMYQQALDHANYLDMKVGKGFTVSISQRKK